VTIAVPAHFDVEVYAALRSLDRRRMLAPGALDRIVPLLARFRAERVPLARLLATAHALGTRFSARDSFYVALADRLRGELVTADRALAGSASTLVRVRLITSR
jgi:predicted nucleic acid-binding protein